MKFLHKVVKIIPQLRTDDERAKLVAITAIERVLNNEGLDWVDIASSLKSFLDQTVGKDLEAPPKPAAPIRPAAQWSTVQSAPIHRPPPPPPPPPRPTPPPPPPQNPHPFTANPQTNPRGWSTRTAAPKKFRNKRAPPPKATSSDFT